MGMMPPSRATWGFTLSIIAGILVIINAAALLSGAFYLLWASIFPWITYFGGFPPWVLVAIGLILGIVIAVGSILMILGYGTIGAVVVFPAAVISLIIGGGFIAGFILALPYKPKIRIDLMAKANGKKRVRKRISLKSTRDK
jgi:hypothetical protein